VLATGKERENRNNPTMKKIIVNETLVNLKLPMAASTVGSKDWKMRA